jgi:hypothetical protein
MRYHSIYSKQQLTEIVKWLFGVMLGLKESKSSCVSLKLDPPVNSTKYCYLVPKHQL